MRLAYPGDAGGWRCRRCGPSSTPGTTSPSSSAAPMPAGVAGARRAPSPVKAAATRAGHPGDRPRRRRARPRPARRARRRRRLRAASSSRTSSPPCRWSTSTSRCSAVAGSGAGRAGDPRRRRDTGVCLMAVEEGLDTGGVYRRAEVPIGPDESADELRARLVEIGTGLLLDALADGFARSAIRCRRRASRPTPTSSPPTTSASTGTAPPLAIHRQVRVGGAWTTHKGRRLKVWRTRALPDAGELELVEVQPEGKGRMTVGGLGERSAVASRRPPRDLSARRRRAARPRPHRRRGRVRQPRARARARPQRPGRARPALRHRSRVRRHPTAATARPRRRPVPAAPGRPAGAGPRCASGPTSCTSSGPRRTPLCRRRSTLWRSAAPVVSSTPSYAGWPRRRLPTTTGPTPPPASRTRTGSSTVSSPTSAPTTAWLPWTAMNEPAAAHRAARRLRAGPRVAMGGRARRTPNRGAGPRPLRRPGGQGDGDG